MEIAEVVVPGAPSVSMHVSIAGGMAVPSRMGLRLRTKPIVPAGPQTMGPNIEWPVWPQKAPARVSSLQTQSMHFPEAA